MTDLAPEPDLADGELVRVRRAVLMGASGLWRDLPWRVTRDPWLVLVSEVMLQQTQATRVVEPFRRFAARFPTPGACAAARSSDVVRAWAGLGYNRRALALHRTAVVLVECHRGRVPADLEALLDLPGIGPYTARAVLVFGWGRALGVVDTNVARVLARAVAGRPLSVKEAQRLADRLVPARDAWRFNQALFDLGARCCTARAPRCGACPLAASCRWARSGPAPLPAAAPHTGPAAAPHTGHAAAPHTGPVAPDPAAPVRRQRPFAGSDRQGRGRLVAALRLAPVPLPALPDAAGWPDDEPRARRIAAALVDEGIACWQGEVLALP